MQWQSWGVPGATYDWLSVVIIIIIVIVVHLIDKIIWLLWILFSLLRIHLLCFNLQEDNFFVMVKWQISFFFEKINQPVAVSTQTSSMQPVRATNWVLCHHINPINVNLIVIIRWVVCWHFCLLVSVLCGKPSWILTWASGCELWVSISENCV